MRTLAGDGTLLTKTVRRSKKDEREREDNKAEQGPGPHPRTDRLGECSLQAPGQEQELKHCNNETLINLFSLIHSDVHTALHERVRGLRTRTRMETLGKRTISPSLILMRSPGTSNSLVT
jgi:hypothetical protein